MSAKREISQDDFNKVKEFVGDNPESIIQATKRVMQLAIESGMKIDQDNIDNWDYGFVTGFVMGALARGIQEDDGEVEVFESDDVNDDRWGF